MRWKLSLSISFLSLAPLPLIARWGISAELSALPYMLLATAIAMLTFVWKERPRIVIVGIVAFVVIISASYIVRAPSGGLYGYDSNVTLALVTQTLFEGYLVPLNDHLRGAEKITNYPLLYILLVILINITGKGPVWAIKLLPLFLLATLPLLAYVLTEGRIRSKTAGATLWATPVLYLSHTGQAVPQLYALPIFALFIALFRLYSRIPYQQINLTFHLFTIIIISSLTLSHSLTPFFALLLVIIIVIVSQITPVPKYYRAPLIILPVALIGMWVFQMNRVIIIEGFATIISAVGLGSVPPTDPGAGVGPVYTNPPNHVSIPFIPFVKHYLRWTVWVARIPLYATSGVFVLYSIYRGYYGDELDLLGISLFLTGITSFFLTIVGPATSIRGWIFMGILVSPVVGHFCCRTPILLPSATSAVRAFLLIVIVTSILIIPMNTFARDAEPDSLTSRNLFPDEQVHSSLGWMNNNSETRTSAVTGTLFFAWEERYRNPSISNPECYQTSCEENTIFWHDEFRKKWFDPDTGGYKRFSAGEDTLNDEYNNIYDAGSAKVFKK